MPTHDHTGQRLKVHLLPSVTKLPSNIYGALVGIVNGPLDNADNNHVFISLRIKQGAAAGVYRVAFNVESNAAPKAAQYHLTDEVVKAADFPKEGFFSNAHLSYTELGLKEKDFKTIKNGMLRTIVHSSVDKAEIVAAYGFTFPNGGIHDIHYNNGERPGSGHANHPGKDGTLVLYFHDAARTPMRRWIFIKFQSQKL